MRISREVIVQSPGESLKVFRLDGPSFDCPFHYHPEFEITWIEEGEGLRVIGDQIERFGDGDLCFMGPGLPHTYRAETGTAPRRCRATVVQFHPDTWLSILGRLPELAKLHQFCRQLTRGAVYDVQAGSGRILPLLRALVREDAVSRVTTFLRLLEELAGAAHRDAASVGYAPLTTPPVPDRISRACERILSGFREPLRQEALAREVGLSPSAFSRQFQRATRLSFSQFVSRVRLSQASRLLQETELGVAEVAFASGFGNLSNFNRRFREYYEVSPRGYRRLIEERRPIPGAEQ